MHHLFPTADPRTVIPGGRKLSPQTAVVVPPVFDFYSTPHRFSGLGVEILCRLIRKQGWKVKFFDFPGQRKKGAPIPLPSALDYLKPHLMPEETGKLSFFTQYQRFGPDITDCARQVAETSPDIVFIACFAFCYAPAALDLAVRVRDLLPGVPMAMGGAGVSAHPEFFLRHPAVDFVLSGEAEIFTPPFLAALTATRPDFSKVPNLYRKTGKTRIPPGEIRRTNAKDILLVLKKNRATKKTVYFSTSLSRGCVKKCRFCSNFLCHGREFRVIPLDFIRNYLQNFALDPEDTGKSVCVNFEDDNLLLAPGYFLEVMDLFRKKFPGAAFLSENGLDYTRLTPDLVDAIISLGLRQFNLSIASIHNPILVQENRETALSRYEAVVRQAAARNVPRITYFICGFQNDTPDTVAATLAFLARQPTRVGISLLYPVPGIPDFPDKSAFDAVSPTLCAGSSAFPWNASLSTAALITAFRLSRFLNLLKSEDQSLEETALARKILEDRRLYTLVRKDKALSLVPVPGADAELEKKFFQALGPLEPAPPSGA